MGEIIEYFSPLDTISYQQIRFKIHTHSCLELKCVTYVSGVVTLP